MVGCSSVVINSITILYFGDVRGRITNCIAGQSVVLVTSDSYFEAFGSCCVLEILTSDKHFTFYYLRRESCVIDSCEDLPVCLFIALFCKWMVSICGPVDNVCLWPNKKDKLEFSYLYDIIGSVVY